MPIASQYGETVTYGNNFVAPIEGRLVSASDIGYGKLREPAFENVGNAFQIGWRNPGLGDYNYQNDVRRDSRLLKPEPVVIEKTVRTRVTEIPGTIQPIYADKINTPISILNSSNRSDGSPAAMPANYVQLIPNENNTMTSQIRYWSLY